MSSQPPLAATWLLSRFGSVPNNAFLLGDLAEEYGRGRSIAWYWRQVIAAIASDFIRTVRAHKMLLVRAIVIGWAFSYVWFHCVDLYLYGRFAKFLLHLGYRPEYWIESPGVWLLLLGFGCIGAVFTGWIVGRLHPPYQITMVLAYVIFAIFVSSTEIFRLVLDSSDDYPRFSPYLWLALTLTALKALSALAGGLWTVNEQRPVMHVESA